MNFKTVVDHAVDTMVRQVVAKAAQLYPVSILVPPSPRAAHLSRAADCNTAAPCVGGNVARAFHQPFAPVALESPSFPPANTFGKLARGSLMRVF